MKRQYFLFYWIWTLFPILGLQAQTGLKINELMASNGNTIADNFQEYDDWIELYNGGSQAMDLTGYYLSDDLDILDKWAFPSHSSGHLIPASGFLLVWADAQVHQGSRHTNFKLSSVGETVYLVDPDGETVIDSIRFGEQFEDIAYGRSPNGGTSLSYMSQPSPLVSNTGHQPIVSPVTISPAAGFHQTSVTVSLACPVPNASGIEPSRV